MFSALLSKRILSCKQGAKKPNEKNASVLAKTLKII